MTRNRTLEDFEARFETMDVTELRRWKEYWTLHADQLAPKVRKVAMKRIHKIDRQIERKLSDQDAT